MEHTSRRIARASWAPIGVAALEENALKVVRSEANMSVIAGPGAGKTELLAQRAAYLLQTGESPIPQRILAISFKRDAASNLAERVKKRCHPSQGERLDSMTFDAFAKSIVDRFGQALPTEWRPKPDYKIVDSDKRAYSDFLQRSSDLPPHLGSHAELMSIKADDFERVHLLGTPLSVGTAAPNTAAQWAAMRFWRRALHGPKGSYLTFPMLGRLAELVFRSNPSVRKAVTLTYSHLFLDEFQDTTRVQYDLVCTMFLGTETVVTAVGDNKQQIMRWAMAMDYPFHEFERDFAATRIPLRNNYRSAPDLVRIQHVLAQALDRHSSIPVSKVSSKVKGDTCLIWNFSTPSEEARHVAEFVAQGIEELKLAPRDYVVLVRQKAEDYAPRIARELAKWGITLRNEAARIKKVPLQDLLTEEVSKLVISVLRLTFDTSAARAWVYLVGMLARLRGVTHDNDHAMRRLESQIAQFCGELRDSYPEVPEGASEAKRLVADILEFVGAAMLRACIASYSQGDWLENVAEAVAQHLYENSADEGWTATMDAYEGLSAVPLMTIHKSKGLEYHTVIFIGLDDGAWWSFKKDEIEATAGFFVAFTRAKQRVIFTYCPTRGDRSTIHTLYDLLNEAKVPMVNMT